MKDETYVFISDVKEKGSIGRSARHRKTHAGKGGRVRLPSDNLSKKELMKMSGECKSYRLNEPMAWKEFKAMPDDVKVTYIKLLRQKFNVPVTQIAKMMGVSEAVVRKDLHRLNLTEGKGSRTGRTKWDKEGFWTWVHGVDQLPTPVLEEKLVIEKMPDRLYSLEEAEAFIEEDIHLEEPDPIPVDSFTPVRIPVTAVPKNGSMNFICPANMALNTLAQLLGDTNVSISVMWRVVEEGKGEEKGE
jgi:hypothetical protein